MRTAEGAALRAFTIELEVGIRPCRRKELPGLEWFVLFDPGVIGRTFTRLERVEALALVASHSCVAPGGRRQVPPEEYRT